jgi:hypothetical protein
VLNGKWRNATVHAVIGARRRRRVFHERVEAIGGDDGRRLERRRVEE